MNKNEYMDKLANALAAFEDEIKNEIVSDYEEHFRMGALNGKSEEQISEELGSIEELIAELEALSQKNTTSADTANQKGEGFSDEAPKVEFNTERFAKALGALSAEFCKKSEQLAKTFMGKAESIDTTKIRNVADAVNKGAKQVGESASSFAKQIASSFEEAMEEYKASASSFEDCTNAETDEELSGECEIVSEEIIEAVDDGVIRKVVIDADCAEVTVVSSSDGKCNFEYENHGSKNQQLAYKFYHYQKGDTVFAGVEKVATRTKYFERITGADIELHVELPEDLKDVHISAASGSVDFDDITADQIKIETISGDIKVREGNSEIMKLNTASGDVDVSGTNNRELTVHTASGDIGVFSGNFGSGKLYTASGDIEINSTDMTGVMIDTASGDVQITGSLNKAAVKSASGDIELEVFKASEVTLSTISGDARLSLNDNLGYTANVKTVSGDILLGYGDEEREDLKNGSYSMGNGESRINISTISGDIEVTAAAAN